MTDSAPIMIPTTYDPACETFRFAWRNERFVLAVFWLRPGSKRNGPVGRPSSSDRGEVEACVPKKLRESAPKIMKSLSRVTLCGCVHSALYMRLLAERAGVGRPLPETTCDHVADD
jgi:hypothetical protein